MSQDENYMQLQAIVDAAWERHRSNPRLLAEETVEFDTLFANAKPARVCIVEGKSQLWFPRVTSGPSRDKLVVLNDFDGRDQQITLLPSRSPEGKIIGVLVEKIRALHGKGSLHARPARRVSYAT